MISRRMAVLFTRDADSGKTYEKIWRGAETTNPVKREKPHRFVWQ
jgi:hypothetical protein